VAGGRLAAGAGGRRAQGAAEIVRRLPCAVQRAAARGAAVAFGRVAAGRRWRAAAGGALGGQARPRQQPAAKRHARRWPGVGLGRLSGGRFAQNICGLAPVVSAVGRVYSLRFCLEQRFFCAQRCAQHEFEPRAAAPLAALAGVLYVSHFSAAHTAFSTVPESMSLRSDCADTTQGGHMA